MLWYSHLSKNFPQFVVIHTVKGFGIVDKAEAIKQKMFFWNSLVFSMMQQMLAICSLLPLPLLNLACVWKFLVHVLLKPTLKDFEYCLASM